MNGVSVYLALGSNIGNREQTLAEARKMIADTIGTIDAASKLYETDPVDFVSPHRFLNQVVKVTTELNPLALLYVTQNIESLLGRSKKSSNENYQDRTCDIDIILYGPAVWKSEELEIPHPKFRDRLFVLEPLTEIAPKAIDPVTGMMIEELYNGTISRT